MLEVGISIPSTVERISCKNHQIKPVAFHNDDSRPYPAGIVNRTLAGYHLFHGHLGLRIRVHAKTDEDLTGQEILHHQSL